MSKRPDPSEYAEYYESYIRRVPEGNIVAVLREQGEAACRFLAGLPADKAEFRYAPEKWTLKEVLGHVIDMEWVFTYRALSFARGAEAALPSVDQDEFMAASDFQAFSLAELVEALRHLRRANTLMFEHFGDEVLERRGEAAGYRFTVRALLYVIAGHERHHMNIIRQRYLGQTT